GIAPDTFSISATACRPRPKWKTSRRWPGQCRTSYEQTECRSRLDPKVQRSGAALYFLPARPAVFRSSGLAGGGGENRPGPAGRARPVSLFSHSVLRIALLVLRLHHGHHDATGKRRALSS